LESLSQASGLTQLCLAESLFSPDIALPEAALLYASAGFWVFPVQAYGKLPRPNSHGLLDATLDEAHIRAWWDDDPNANIGINCGRSSLLVVDVDPRNGGDLALKNWTLVCGPLPPTLCVLTPGGGKHFYYYVPEERMVRKGKLCQGVDIQAAGGYVVAPPSQTLYGSYVWAPR